MPCSHGSSESHASASCARRQAIASVLVVVVLAATGTADHDLVFLDRDLDRAVTRPVLGVDRIILDGGIQPQAVPLFAVIEGAFESRCNLPPEIVRVSVR